MTDTTLNVPASVASIHGVAASWSPSRILKVRSVRVPRSFHPILWKGATLRKLNN